MVFWKGVGLLKIVCFPEIRDSQSVENKKNPTIFQELLEKPECLETLEIPPVKRPLL